MYRETTLFPARDHEELREYLAEMDRDELMSQQIVEHGAIHALEFLLEHDAGDTRALAKAMLEDLRRSMVVTGEVADEHGVRLQIDHA